MTQSALPALRRSLAHLEREGTARARDVFSFSLPDVDQALGGGLARGALHEVYALGGPDVAAATGFAIALALRAAQGSAAPGPAASGPIVWARQDYVDTESGRLHAPGLADLGLDPDRVIVVQAPDALGVLRAGAEALRCSALSAVLIEPWGEAGAIDLVATRRLSLAAGGAGVPALMVRVAATPKPSAAATRWAVRSLPSQALEAGAPGLPAFAITLLRNRAGTAGHEWRVEWNRDERCFRNRHGQELGRAPPALSRTVGAVSANRPGAGSADWPASAAADPAIAEQTARWRDTG
jgi:protein ImuA